MRRILQLIIKMQFGRRIMRDDVLEKWLRVTVLLKRQTFLCLHM